jgi:hypothetical protein
MGKTQSSGAEDDFTDLLREVDALMRLVALLRSRIEAKAREHERDRNL